MEQHSAEDNKAVVNKLRELAQLLASSPALSGSWYCANSGCVIVFAKGETETEARRKAEQQAKGPAAT